MVFSRSSVIDSEAMIASICPEAMDWSAPRVISPTWAVLNATRASTTDGSGWRLSPAKGSRITEMRAAYSSTYGLSA